MKIKSVYIIYKRSVYQRFYLDEKSEKLRRLFKRKHFSVTQMKDIHNLHLNAVKRIQNYLAKHGIAYKTASRHNPPSFKGFDLIITVGGDGTFLRTAHFVKNDVPLLPVNSDPKQSVGALCSVTIGNFRSKMDEILSGKVKIKKLPLMQIKVNGKALPAYAVNDALFTNISPAATSRYFVKYNKAVEEHKSSGIWVATATGSTAAISAAGGHKRPAGENRLQFATREPYQGNFHPYKVVQGLVDKGKKLTIVSKMIRSKIYIDGPTNAFDVHYGDEIEFKIAKRKIKVLA